MTNRRDGIGPDLIAERQRLTQSDEQTMKKGGSQSAAALHFFLLLTSYFLLLMSLFRNLKVSLRHGSHGGNVLWLPPPRAFRPRMRGL